MDPNNGDIYYVYGNRDPGTGNDRLAIRRIQDDGGEGVTVGPENFVTGQVEAAIPSVAVAGKRDGGHLLLHIRWLLPVDGFPIFTAHLVSSDDQGVTFTDGVQLVTFLSSAKDCNVDPSFCQPGADPDRQRVLGDYMQIKAVEKLFLRILYWKWGAISVGLSPTTIQSSSGSASAGCGSGNHQDRLARPGDNRKRPDLHCHCNQ